MTKISLIYDPRTTDVSATWLRQAWKVKDVEGAFRVKIDLDLLNEHDVSYEFTAAHDLIIFLPLRDVLDFAD